MLRMIGLFTSCEAGNIPWFSFYRYVNIYFQWKKTATSIAKNYLSKQNCDIVHLNSHALTSWAYAARQLGLKVVLHNREPIAKGYLGIRFLILKRLIEQNCDAVINISEDDKKRFRLKKNVHVVYNFIGLPSIFRLSMADKKTVSCFTLEGKPESKALKRQ